MVTTKGAGLNPNAKVWQEIPAHQSDVPEGPEDAAWLLSYPPPAEMTDGGKGYEAEYPDAAVDYASVPAEGIMDGTDHPDLGFIVFDPQCKSPTDGSVSEEQPMSEESLRESLKKQLEFCFSRENLSKDLYLISQMDSDQFVPIWTIACMEDIKALTSDMNLILDVLRASPMVQVDEAGEKVRPNHSRCIIILREVPETTPVEEVEALFKSEDCPKALSAEFAHNSNWYITFQSDKDAQQAYRYLREEVKTFQGKPIMARIKAINTFFGKNGFRAVDSNVYSQHAQPQAQYGSPVYMQQAYSPQQQFPVYPVVSPSWNPPVMPYFDTPLAPFMRSGYMNGYSSSGNYDANSNSHRPISRNRNHGGQPRLGDVPPPAAPGPLMDGHSGPWPLQTSGTGVTPAAAALSSFSLNDTSPQAAIPGGHLNGAARGRRGSHRGMRRKREDDMRPIPLMETKVPPPPKFDLEASNFPPLPGSVVSSRGESMPEMRLSDVVRGLKVTSKPVNQEVNASQQTHTSEDAVRKPDSVMPVAKLAPVTPLAEFRPALSGPPPAVKEDDKAEPPVQKEAAVASSPAACEPPPSTCSQSESTEAPSPSPPTPTSDLGERKLSYAEVCQRMAKDPPPVQTPSPPASVAGQPLQELKVNRVEEPTRSNSKHATEKPGDGRPPRQPLRSFRDANGQVRSAGLKMREHQRNLNASKPFSPHRGPRRSGKEQNIPPSSPK